jgi:peptide/nickel transport system ATP-binding protein
MRQRVVLALAFACEPKLIIADEPTTALDVSVQAQVIELLKRMCRDHGTAVLLITHDMGVIADTADRIAVMYAGRPGRDRADAISIESTGPSVHQGLMASIPSMRRRGATLAQIEGSMPRLDAMPSGCAFHPRCAVRIERCDRERPDLMQAATSKAACWLVVGAPAVADMEVHDRG